MADDVTTRFVEQMGLTCEAYGLSRIAGRLLGLFIIENQPRSLDELAERLAVSKASISTNARFLEQLGILERQSRPGDRRDFYHLGSDPWENMFEVAKRRMGSILQVFDEALQQMPEEADTRVNMARWHAFYSFMLDDLDSKLARWRERLSRDARLNPKP